MNNRFYNHTKQLRMYRHGIYPHGEKYKNTGFSWVCEAFHKRAIIRGWIYCGYVAWGFSWRHQHLKHHSLRSYSAVSRLPLQCKLWTATLVPQWTWRLPNISPSEKYLSQHLQNICRRFLGEHFVEHYIIFCISVAVFYWLTKTLYRIKSDDFCCHFTKVPCYHLR